MFQSMYHTTPQHGLQINQVCSWNTENSKCIPTFKEIEKSEPLKGTGFKCKKK